MDLPDHQDIDLSLGEAEALARNASRGACYSWGQADECAAAVRWLESRQLPGLRLLSERLRRIDDAGCGADYRACCPSSVHADDLEDSRQLCPIATAGLLNDHAHLLDARTELTRVEDPLLLLPALHALAEYWRAPTGIEWVADTTSTTLHIAQGAVYLASHNTDSLLAPMATEISIVRDVDKTSGAAKPLQSGSRACISQPDLHYLSAVANRTRAPVSAESRARGAG